MLDIPLWKRIMIAALCALGLWLALPNAFYTTVERHNDALVAIEENGATPDLQADVDAWPSYMPASLVNLGLDLRGGVHLLAEVQVEDTYATRMNGMWTTVRDTLRAERATIGGVRQQDAEPGFLRVRIGNEDAMPRALELLRSLAQPVTTLAGVGEMDLVFSSQGDVITITLSDAEKAAMDERTLVQTLEIVRRRVDEVGTREPTIQRQGTNRVLIQVPGLGSAEELKELLGTTAKLEFRPVVRRTTDPDVSPGAGNEIMPSVDEPGQYYIVEKGAVVGGEDLTNAQPTVDQNGGQAVSFSFNISGAKKFGDYTAENIGSPFAIVLDGEVISAPTIQSHIAGGSGIITGRFTIEETIKLSALLRAGALPAKLSFEEERTIGPELGQDSIEAGRIACIVAFIAVLVFMVLSYGTFGMFANIALIINVGLIFGLLSLIGATLTLPGIAGIVLTIGMAVDANVLIFERIREELKAKRGPARAIELGYEKALSAIIDANITTFITAVILFLMGSGPVKGFAITLGLGIITSVFTAIFVTRLVVVIWFERKRPKEIEV
ncbi:protein translocase subunit SecD [Halocynthiibacter sp.]|uniref:protein translocase subunit SecD n=1 Tax=Halocynthiibacter sp. TaxID=1979210 RepID=UPI003C38A35B